MPVFSLLSALSIFALGSQNQPAKSYAENDTPRPFSTSIIVENIEKSLRECKRAKTSEEKFRVLRSAAANLLPQVQSNVLITKSLRDALTETKNQAGSAKFVDRLTSMLGEAREILTFKPVMEAPLPVDFPVTTPVGQIQIKKYPSYRLAKTTSAGRGNNAFFTLFRHIKSKQIAMTAPVEMTYDKTGKIRKSSMAFLYRSRQLGQVGKAGDVEVVDVPDSMALSIGLRGNITIDRLEEARGYLQSWLKQHGEQYEVAGPLRVMGYNSPFILGKRRFSEVQFPIREKRNDNLSLCYSMEN